MIVALLALTMFVSAFLLFWSQPMVAKMVLPFLGGSASVWTACVLFFQAVLLAGYVYAHFLGTLRLKTQFLIHGAVVLTAVIFLPPEFVGAPDRNAMEHPTIWLLLKLITTIGIPFFVLSATAPLLQTWLARTKLEARRNPYSLYAASNAGSLLALLIYPLLIEPRAGLSAQSAWWSAGYGLLAFMILTGALIVGKHAVREDRQESSLPQPPANKMRMYWLAAAFVPSALMLAVTNHISMNLASAPFLWIVPLAIYLLTFILAFAATTGRSQTIFIQLSRWSPIALLVFLPIIPDVSPPDPALNWLLMLEHLLVLFFGAWFCHTALAARRPDPRHLTEFYFWLALGGALGGVFAAVIAPAIFRTILEYPLLVALLPFFRQPAADANGLHRGHWKDWAFPGIVGLAFAANWYVQRITGMQDSASYAVLLPDVVFFVTVFLFRKQRVRFALGYVVLLWGYTLTLPAVIEDAQRIHVARNFFGVKKVLFDVNSNVRKLLHGDTLHGVESRDPARSGVALSYYHESGPAGDVMRLIGTRPDQKVAVIGLGSGSMAAYAGPTRHITFLDVDPQVADIALGFFTFLRRCGEDCTVVIADGRLGMESMRDGQFDVIMVDAFSSDSIPVHLASREAMRVYMAKLKPDGVLLFHVSNRYLLVDRLVGVAVADAGMVGLLRSDREEQVRGKSGSDYVVAARRLEDLGEIGRDHRWQGIPPDTQIEPWTDNYSNILRLVKWR